MTITIRGFDDIDVYIDNGMIRIEQAGSAITVAPRAADQLCAAIKECAAEAIKAEDEE